jgi:FHA domain
MEKDVLSIGRAEGNDVRLENPYVSRRHAVVRRAGAALVIEDAGSTGGLLINGVKATEPALLRTGDRIRIGEVELELVGPGTRAPTPAREERTMVGAAISAIAPLPVEPVAPVAPPDPPEPSIPVHAPEPSTRAPASAPTLPAAPGESRFDVDNQRAAEIHNVAGNQYSSRVGNQFNVGSLRILEPMRRRARLVMRAGFTLILCGFAAYIAAALIFGSGVVKCFHATDTTNPSTCLHPGALVFALAGVASIGFGVITVVISLFMKREVRREEARLDRAR